MSGATPGRANGFSTLWLQVPDVSWEETRLIELPLADPDGHAVILVEVPEDHFLRRQL